MNRRTVAHYGSQIFLVLALLSLGPVLLALYDQDLRALQAHGATGLITACVAMFLRYVGRESPSSVHRKDAIGVVVLSWLGASLCGTLPFLLEGELSDPADALFESVSGYTTTGATVVPGVELLSRATNLWRCLTHWVGGLGIIILFVAVFPQFGVGAKHLFRIEVPGPITEGLRPRITHTVLALSWLYLTLTIALAVGLWLLGFPVYDAVCHGLSTLSTGGFSTRSLSIGAYGSPAAEWLIMAFMLLSSLNFGLYYSAMQGNPLAVLRNYEVRFFLGANLLVALALTLVLWERYGDVGVAFRFASFQTVSITSTTGFMTDDYNAYPNVARYLLYLAMFMGGCAGSTSGGLKASRIYALILLTLREVRAVVQPQGVIVVRLGAGALPRGVVRSVLVYMATYFLVFAVASTCMVAVGLPVMTAMSAVVACLSGVGPGFEGVGPTEHYGWLPTAGKLVLSWCMIAGRLEVFALLAILDPECWRR